MIMTFEQFKYYLEAYGASLHRWPDEARAPAANLLASSPAAAAALSEARRLDKLLDSVTVPHKQDAERRFVEAVVSRAARVQPVRRTFDLIFGLPFWPRTAILAAVAILGVVTGVFQVERQTYDTGTVDVAQSLSSDTPLEVAGL